MNIASRLIFYLRNPFGTLSNIIYTSAPIQTWWWVSRARKLLVVWSVTEARSPPWARQELRARLQDTPTRCPGVANTR